MAKKNVTFADIAAYTGFSKTTISRYFNNPDSITVENQEKIANALEVLDYKENKLARVMANGKTEMVGVIIPNLYMHYYSDMLDHIISTYEEYGYKFIVFAGNEDADVERRYIQELLAYKTEGLIILSHTLSSKELAEYHVPIVTIEREDEYVCSVNTDTTWAACRLQPSSPKAAATFCSMQMQIFQIPFQLTNAFRDFRIFAKQMGWNIAS